MLLHWRGYFKLTGDTVQAVDQIRIFKNNRCKVGTSTVNFNATRRDFASVFSRMQKRVFFDESERRPCAKPCRSCYAMLYVVYES